MARMETVPARWIKSPIFVKRDNKTREEDWTRNNCEIIQMGEAKLVTRYMNTAAPRWEAF